jgi:hypothetical protein
MDVRKILGWILFVLLATALGMGILCSSIMLWVR